MAGRAQVNLSRLTLTLLALCAGFLMVTCGADFKDFAPVAIPIEIFYLFTVTQGIAAALLKRQIGPTFVALLVMDVASAAVFVGAIAAVIKGLGVPIELDLIAAWASSPLFVYLAFMLILQSCGAFAGILFVR